MLWTDHMLLAVVDSCSDTEFMCDRRSCVDASRVCDFTDDCGDQSDEMDCGKCLLQLHVWHRIRYSSVTTAMTWTVIIARLSDKSDLST